MPEYNDDLTNLSSLFSKERGPLLAASLELLDRIEHIFGAHFRHLEDKPFGEIAPALLGKPVPIMPGWGPTYLSSAMAEFRRAVAAEMADAIAPSDMAAIAKELCDG